MQINMNLFATCLMANDPVSIFPVLFPKKNILIFLKNERKTSI